MPALVALVVTATLLFQSAYVFPAVGWAAMHGAFDVAGVALVLTPIAVVWACWAVLRRRRPRVAVPGMLTVAAGLLVVGELLLPVTPFKARAHQIAVDTTVVEDVSDAPLLSAGGRPIGIRLSYRVSFPRGGAYSVSPALALPAREATVPIPSALHLGLVREPQSTPPPFATGEAGERGYLGGVSYAFTVDLLPQFVRYASPAGEPCLVVPPNVNYSEDEFLTVVDNGLRTPYRIELLVDGQPGARRRVAWQYETAREYDVSEFYRSLVAEGVVACSA